MPRREPTIEAAKNNPSKVQKLIIINVTRSLLEFHIRQCYTELNPQSAIEHIVASFGFSKGQCRHLVLVADFIVVRPGLSVYLGFRR